METNCKVDEDEGYSILLQSKDFSERLDSYYIKQQRTQYDKLLQKQIVVLRKKVDCGTSRRQERSMTPRRPVRPGFCPDPDTDCQLEQRAITPCSDRYAMPIEVPPSQSIGGYKEFHDFVESCCPSSGSAQKEPPSSDPPYPTSKTQMSSSAPKYVTPRKAQTSAPNCSASRKAQTSAPNCSAPGKSQTSAPNRSSPGKYQTSAPNCSSPGKAQTSRHKVGICEDSPNGVTTDEDLSDCRPTISMPTGYQANSTYQRAGPLQQSRSRTRPGLSRSRINPCELVPPATRRGSGRNWRLMWIFLLLFLFLLGVFLYFYLTCRSDGYAGCPEEGTVRYVPY